MGISLVFLKFVIYIVWCFYGIRLFNPKWQGQALKGIGLGFVKLLIGITFNFILVIRVMDELPFLNLYMYKYGFILMYFAIHIPLRWVEWAIMDMIVSPTSATLKSFLFGYSKSSRFWRTGGIIISFTTDILILLTIDIHDCHNAWYQLLMA